MSLSSSKIRDIVGQKRQPVILEIGANTGEDTCSFLECYPEAVVYCFEPDPRCCQLWRDRSFGENVHLYEGALSDKDEQRSLYLSEAEYPKSASIIRRLARKFMRRSSEIVVSSLGQSSIISPESRTTQYPWLVFTKEVKVPSLRLDTWRNRYASDLTRIDFIWSDVQGAERRLIEGARQTLEITRYMTLEYGECNVYGEALDRDQTIQLMRDNSFRLRADLSDIGPIGSMLFENERLAEVEG
jgi:FkbM family methyltransferase